MEGVSIYFLTHSFLSHHAPELIGLWIVLLAQGAFVFWILRGPAAVARQWARRAIWAGAIGSFFLVNLAFLLRFYRVARHFSPWYSSWGRGLVIVWALFSILSLIALAISRILPRARPEHSPARRNFLRAAHVILFGAPAVAVGYGTFIERLRISMREVTINIPDLPPDLHGVRLVQLTDIHLSPFLSERDLERAVAMANETRAHLALVTGDLITMRGDPLDACLNSLARLRAEAGILGCLGNHESYAGTEQYTTEQGARLGLRFLRSAAASLKFGGSILNVAGVDYQEFRKPYLVGAEKLVQPGAYNLILSHNPDVFPVASRQGFDLTVAGHTHGGQVRVEILRQDLNVARFFTPYVDGIYRQGSSAIFVSRGIGTIGLPTRLGSAPEVALITLCHT